MFVPLDALDPTVGGHEHESEGCGELAAILAAGAAQGYPQHEDPVVAGQQLVGVEA